MTRVILPILFVFIIGCCPYRNVPNETVVKDSLYITQRLIDRVMIRDSVYERHVHDTVYQYRERETLRYLSLHDTLYIERRDSVRISVPVEKELTRWEKIRLSVGGFAILACAILILYFGFRIIRRFKC